MIRFERVSFRYGWRESPVLDGFTWKVPAARTALLGPNGAGKSTMLALAANASRPFRGSLSWNGLNPQRWRERAAYRRAIGWMPQAVRPVPGLTVREQVAYAGWLKGLSSAEAWGRSVAALENVGLGELADRKSVRVSGGQLRRIGLAQVLIHDPVVLLLDEPTVGLDPAQRARFRTLLAELASDVPILVSTHQTDDLSDLFDTVAIVESGQIRFQGSIADLLAYAPVGDPARRVEAAYAAVLAGSKE